MHGELFGIRPRLVPGDALPRSRVERQDTLVGPFGAERRIADRDIDTRAVRRRLDASRPAAGHDGVDNSIGRGVNDRHGARSFVGHERERGARNRCDERR
jgi:hypothetical protein